LKNIIQDTFGGLPKMFIYSVWFMCLLYEVMLHGYAYGSNLLAAKRSTLFVETEAILSDTGEQLDFKW
jgi:hypothetical protein